MTLVRKCSLIFLFFCVIALGVSVFIPLDKEKLKPQDLTSLRIFDKKGCFFVKFFRERKEGALVFDLRHISSSHQRNCCD